MSLLGALDQQPADLRPDELIDGVVAGGAELHLLDTGDPGTVHDVSTAIADLPPYDGPAQPVGGPAPEWGATAADSADEGPLAGPALAPYPQASDADAD